MHQGRHLVRLVCQLRAWDVDPEEGDARLGLIALGNRLDHPPGESSTDTIRADVACIARSSARFCGGGSYVPVQQALLERFATPAGFHPEVRKYRPIDEGISQLNIDSLIEVARIEKEHCVEKRWKFRAGDTTFDLSEKAEDIISLFHRLKGIGDIAVQHDAGHTALPWATIRLDSI